MNKAYVIVLAATLGACTRREMPDYMADLRARNDAAIAAQEYRIAHPDLSPARLEDYRLRAEDADRQAASYKAAGIKQSDLAECRSRTNAAFADVTVKLAIMNDCIDGRRLKRQGH